MCSLFAHEPRCATESEKNDEISRTHPCDRFLFTAACWQRIEETWKIYGLFFYFPLNRFQFWFRQIEAQKKSNVDKYWLQVAR